MYQVCRVQGVNSCGGEALLLLEARSARLVFLSIICNEHEDGKEDLFDTDKETGNSNGVVEERDLVIALDSAVGASQERNDQLE